MKKEVLKMAIVDILTVLTHNGGQVLTTVVQSGQYGIGSITSAIGSATAATTSLTMVFLNAMLKGLS